jgi:transaldolase
MLDLTQIKVFYDGMDIDKYAKNKFVQGFTTNCTFFSKYKVRNYTEYYNSIKDSLAGRPLSLQIWEDDQKAIEQIDTIHALAHDAYVKIPILNSRGEYNTAVYSYAKEKKLRVNVTALHTNEHIDKVYELFKDYDQPYIVSIFVGPISDVGNDPSEFISYTVKKFKDKKQCEILWAGCREVFGIYRAIQGGCHIITCPDSVIDKLEHLGKSCEQLTSERVATFRNDAIASQLSI